MSLTISDRLARAWDDLDRIDHLLSFSGGDRSRDDNDWLLIAGLLVDAAAAIEAAGFDAPADLKARFEEVHATFSEETHGFTLNSFLQSSKAARRHNQDLFRFKRHVD